MYVSMYTYVYTYVCVYSYRLYEYSTDKVYEYMNIDMSRI